MKNIYKIGIGATAFVLLMGSQAMAIRNSIMPAPKDSVKAVADADVPESSVVDEVIWVVGDEPILKSDVETMRLQGQMEGITWKSDPDCAIPEEMAGQR